MESWDFNTVQMTKSYNLHSNRCFCLNLKFEFRLIAIQRMRFESRARKLNQIPREIWINIFHDSLTLLYIFLRLKNSSIFSVFIRFSFILNILIFHINLNLKNNNNNNNKFTMYLNRNVLKSSNFKSFLAKIKRILSLPNRTRTWEK